MADKPKFKRGKPMEMTLEDLHGFDLKTVTCHSCSGYGNCGYRSYRILDGKPVLICMQRMTQLEEAREASGE